MDLKKFKERWEAVSEGHYLEDVAYEGHRPLEGLIEALQIITKYVKGSYHAEHDILYIGENLTENLVSITDAEIIRLSELGIHWSEEFEAGFVAFC